MSRHAIERLHFNRRDIIVAHLLLEFDYHLSGVLQERPSNQRRHMSTDSQVYRMGKCWPWVSTLRERLLVQPDRRSTTRNARAIYKVLQKRYGFR